MLHVLPIAAGAAVSPTVFGVSVEILIAFAKLGTRMLALYLLGAALVVTVAAALAAVLPQPPRTSGEQVIGDIVDLVFGSILLILALVVAVRRPSQHPRRSHHNLLSSRWAGWGAVALGLVMMVTNFSTLVLVLAGAHEITSSSAGALVRTIAYGMLGLGALAPILIPLLWATLRPTDAARGLQRINAFLDKHGRLLGVVVCGLTGLYLVLRGFRVI